MVTAIFTILIYAILLAILIYIVLYALGVIGVALTAKVVQLIWLAFGLIVLFWLYLAVVRGGGLSLPGLS